MDNHERRRPYDSVISASFCQTYIAFSASILSYCSAAVSGDLCVIIISNFQSYPDTGAYPCDCSRLYVSAHVGLRRTLVSHYRIALLQVKSSPADNLPAKIRPTRRPPGRGGFILIRGTYQIRDYFSPGGFFVGEIF